MRERGEEECQPNTGDSTTMTIEFLRARLLSERSVSRTAKQRADLLAKRVVELEEQLRTVTIQRKQAEMAAAEVLAVLDSHGIGDSSEVVDSSAGEEDVSNGPRRGENTLNEDTNSVGSRTEKSEPEDKSSGSTLDVSPNQGRSLSWTRNSNSSDSFRKQKLKQMRQSNRRNNLFCTLDPSSKHLMGKSCRKIKRRDTGLAVGDAVDRPTFDAHRNGGMSYSACNACSAIQSCQNDQSEETDIGIDNNTSDRDEEMKRVLEDQAKLIDQYRDEENAQREWEEKYNEKQSSSLGVPGFVSEPAPMLKFNLSEEDAAVHSRNIYSDTYRNEPCSLIKDPAVPSRQSTPVPVVPANLHDIQECWSTKATAAKSDGLIFTDVNKSGNLCSDNRGNNSFIAQELDMSDKSANASSHEVLFPFRESSFGNNMRQDSKVLYETSEAGLRQSMDRLSESCRMASSSSNSNHAMPRWKMSEVPANSVGGVLKALQSAKMSLQQQLGNPSSSDATLAIRPSFDPPVHHVDYDKMLGIPINSSGLFRLPTDSFAQSSSPAHMLNPSGLRLTSSSIVPKYSNNDLRENNHNMYAANISASKPYLDPYMASDIALRRPSAYFFPESSMARVRNSFQDEYGGSYMDDRQDILGQPKDYLYAPRGTLPDQRRL